jgi:hypothetical protein
VDPAELGFDGVTELDVAELCGVEAMLLLAAELVFPAAEFVAAELAAAALAAGFGVAAAVEL